MLTITYANSTTQKSKTINIFKFFKSLFIISSIIFIIFVYGDVILHMEKYVTTW